jgi:hypothetical protein
MLKTAGQVRDDGTCYRFALNIAKITAKKFTALGISDKFM